MKQKCLRCGSDKSEHGPEMQCPCIVYSYQGRSVIWNPCKFQGMETVKATSRAAKKERGI